MSSILAVSEIYGPVYQGEGPSSGKACTFLRLAGCNLKCSWCDTKYTWNWDTLESRYLREVRKELGLSRLSYVNKHGETYDPATEITSQESRDVIEKILLHATNETEFLVVTGGEPMLQQKALGPLLSSLLIDYNLPCEIETNGTIVPVGEGWSSRYRRFNVSVKLVNSGDWNVAHSNVRLNQHAISWHAGNPYSIFKFVVQNGEDLVDVRLLAESYSIPNDKIWIMPEGTDSKTVKEGADALSAPGALPDGWHLTRRLHVEQYGSRRGV